MLRSIIGDESAADSDRIAACDVLLATAIRSPIPVDVEGDQ